MGLRLPDLSTFAITDKEIIKNDDGGYDVVTTKTVKIKNDTIEKEVAKLQTQIDSIKAEYPDVFKVIKT